MTSDLNVKFLKPVYINGKTLKVTCRLTAREGPKVHMEATIANSDNVSCTTATGTFHVLSPEKYEALIHEMMVSGKVPREFAKVVRKV